MLKMVCLVVVNLFLVCSTVSFAAEGCGHDCRQCHSISMQDITKVLNTQDGLKGSKILSVEHAPVGGLWQVVIEKDSKPGVIYVDFSKKHVLYGAIVAAHGEENLTQRTVEGSYKVNMADINLQEAFLLGNKDAKTKIVVFSDPGCSHCANLHKELKAVIKERSDIAIYVVLYPLAINQGSYEKAKSIQCSKSIAYLEAAYSGLPIPLTNCNSTAIDKNIAVAKKYGITGTPTIVFPNGSIYFGVLTKAELLQKAINGRVKK